MTNTYNCAFVTVDDGSGNIKLVTQADNGEFITVTQPSAVKENEAIVCGAGTSKKVWTVNNVPYSVAPDLKGLCSTTSEAYQSSIANRVLVHDIVANQHINKPIVLAVTIPTCQYFTADPANPINTVAIERKRQNLMGDITNQSGELETPNFVSIKVYPEAIPAYVYCSMSEDGTKKDGYDDEHDTLVVDLGHYTCDIARIKNGLNVIEKATLAHGVHKVLNKFRNILTQRNTLGAVNLSMVNDTVLSRAFQNNFWGSEKNTDTAINARIDLTDIINELKIELYNEIFADIETLIGAGMVSALDRVIFVGGGAYVIADIAKSNNLHHDIVVPNEPEFAIAKGTHMLLLSQASRICSELSATTNEQAPTTEVTEA